jgi:CHAT domain-containing protein
LRIRQLQEAIEKEGVKPGPQQRGDAVQIFTQELLAAQREYRNLLDDLRSTQPAYVSLRTLSVPSDREIQSKLPPDAALLEYVVSDDSVAIFVLTSTNLRAKTVPLRAADLRAKVELFRDLVVGERTDAWRKPAESLLRLLIEPVEQAGWLNAITRLYVVPHGVLHYLPFAALPRSSAQGSRYLVEDYVLAYLPAAATLYFQPPANGSRTLLALAPASSHLRFAAQEAQSVRRLFPDKGVALVGGSATESAFKGVARNYGIIHFATHGYFNKANPIFSGVQLEADQKNDGRLEVHEILALRLDAGLVTLSACETALGSGYFSEVPAGDEFVGLTRAFLFAGSSSVVASVWEVNDRSTMQFMDSFYRRLRPAGAAGALAQAQRETLRRGGLYRHPYYWAPFVLTGAMK